MGLFGKPRKLKQLDHEVTAARIALSMFDRLPADKQQHVLVTAPREIRDAAMAAAGSGHAVAARDMLTEARAQAPKSSAAERWPGIVDSALAAL